MKASRQERTGGIGVSDAMSNFQRIGWGPVPNYLHDLGTDLLVQARDAWRNDRGLIVGVQVKGGPSYFTERCHDNGTLTGWWYTEPDADHFDDWVQHGLPHILVLQDIDTRVSYWVHVTATAVQSTGKGYKILVPCIQTVDEAHLDALMKVAATHKPALMLEGTAWTAGAANIAPARRLRYALLVPRLVAPHRNAGVTRPLLPEEGVALLVQARVHDYERFAEAHDSVPTLETATDSSDWRWRFVGGLADFVTEGNSAALGNLVSTAPSADRRVAAQVLQACALLEHERYDEAVDVLPQLDEDENVSPVDRAWLHTQRARLLAEVGDVALARQEAAAAIRAVVGDPDDPTASAISASATALLFRTAAWGNQRVDDMVRAHDTAVSWWRSQTHSWALAEATERAFRAWTGERSTRFMAEDVPHNQLYSAALTASLVGDQGAWRSSSSLLARTDLMRGSNSEITAEAVNGLRRSGDDKSLKDLLLRGWHYGPAAALQRAVAELPRIDGWTHSTSRANLVMWRHAGDLLSTARASAAIQCCLAILNSQDSFTERTTPSYLVENAVLETVSGLMGAADDPSHRSVIDHLMALPPVTDDLTAIDWARIVSHIRPSALPADTVDVIYTKALTQTYPRLSAQLLGLIAASRPAAQEALVERVLTGDGDALAALADLRELPQAAAETMIAHAAVMVARTTAEAHAGTYSVRSLDWPHVLAVLNLWFPAVARWKPLYELLNDPLVGGGDKRGAALTLASGVEQLSLEVRAELRKVQLVEPPLPWFGRLGLGGSVFVLAAAVGAVAGDELFERLSGLLSGPPEQRRDATIVMTKLEVDNFDAALLPLLVDVDADVRINAAAAVAVRLRNSPSQVTPLLLQAARAALADPGILVPAVFLEGLRGEMPSGLVSSVRAMLEHPSARVRHAADELLKP